MSSNKLVRQRWMLEFSVCLKMEMDLCTAHQQNARSPPGKLTKGNDLEEDRRDYGEKRTT